MPNWFVGDPATLGADLGRRVSQLIDRPSGGDLVIRGLLDEELPGRCRFRLAFSPAPSPTEEWDLVVELPLAEGPPPGLPVADLRGMDVGLLDPHPLAALILGHRLRRCGARVTHFETRAALLDAIGQPGARPEVLVLGLPAGTDSPMAQEWLAACRGTGALPMLVVLSGAQQGLAESVCQAGAGGCLIRPFTTQTLVEALRGLRDTPEPLGSPQDRVRALEIVGGDDALAAELLQTLADTLPASLAELDALVEAEDWQGVRAQAHRLRGAASYCALPDLWAAAGALEQVATRGELPAIQEGLGELRRQAERVLRYCPPAG